MNRLRELREEAFMTVRELSERSGVSEDTITKIENGHRKGRGMTIRKLAKALGATPHQLSPEQFEQRADSEILSQDSLLNPEAASMSSTEVGDQDVPEYQKVVQALNVVDAVMNQSGLGAQAHLKHLSERQRNVLLAVTGNEAVTLPEVARQAECGISAANRDLAILGEYGLVSRNEAGENHATPLGEGVAGILTKGGLHYDEALRHIFTLLKAYESARVREDRSQRSIEMDAQLSQLFIYLQESIVRTIKGIVNVAEPSPDAQPLRKQSSPSTTEDTQTSLTDLAQRSLTNVAQRIRTQSEQKSGPVLAPREVELLHQLATGKTHQQIAKEMHISVSTLKNYIAKIVAKIGVPHHTQEIMRLADRGSRPE